MGRVSFPVAVAGTRAVAMTVAVVNAIITSKLIDIVPGHRRAPNSRAVEGHGGPEVITIGGRGG